MNTTACPVNQRKTGKDSDVLWRAGKYLHRWNVMVQYRTDTSGFLLAYV